MQQIALHEGRDFQVLRLPEGREFVEATRKSIEEALLGVSGRERRLPEPGPLNLIRKQDQLEIDLPDPDLSVYDDEGERDDETKSDN